MTFEEFKSITRVIETTPDELKEDYKKYEMWFKYFRMTKKNQQIFFEEKIMLR